MGLEPLHLLRHGSYAHHAAGEPAKMTRVRPRHLPLAGVVVWLTAEQGGRDSGPPLPGDVDDGYCSVAYVPPRDIDADAASFCLGDFEPGAWRSKARGGWLLAQTERVLCAGVGDVVVVCEGRRVVAYFHVMDTE